MFDSLQNQLERTLKSLRGQAKIRPAHIEEALENIKTSLLEADVQYQVVNRFLERVKTAALGADVAQSLTPYQQFIRILQKEMLSIFGEAKEIDLSGKPPVVLMMVGLQGSGKTTSSAKIALYAKKKLKRKPLLVSVDVNRPAAIEQLERLAEDVKLDCFKTSSMVPLERAQAAIKYAQTYGLDLVIVDTAGRLSIDEALMKELESFKENLKPQVILYVADAMSGQQGLQVAEGFSNRIGLTGAVLTKSDGDTRGGVAFSIREAIGVPLQFVGTGEKMDALEVFHPDRWVSRILGMGDVVGLMEKADEAMKEQGEDETKDQAKRMMKGQLSLQDFQQQMKMMSKMGSIGGLMGMIPGMSGMAAKIDHAAIEKKMKRVDAMINSMTLQERSDPDVLNGNRRRRIALGSGTQVEDLNQFLREFTEMQKLMKRFSGKKMKGLAGMFGGR
ncbi:MAG: signal recognition particle protein [Deltaproteobacteria bacterium]|nr:signal recognition particle protein [Deltaproteobacteria bacterium]